MKTALLIVALACIVFLNESRGQQTSKSSSDASIRQTVQAQSKVIADLTERVTALEEQLPRSRQGQEFSAVPAKRSSLVLTSVKTELERFDDGCKSEQDRAAAMALSQNLPALTYMGGAAMNCTERLKKITDHLVETLESQ